MSLCVTNDEHDGDLEKHLVVYSFEFNDPINATAVLALNELVEKVAYASVVVQNFLVRGALRSWSRFRDVAECAPCVFLVSCGAVVYAKCEGKGFEGKLSFCVSERGICIK
jgi:hypothetical protein